MFEPKQLRIDYRIAASSGRTFSMSIQLNERGVLRSLPTSKPGWTLRSEHGCADCAAGSTHCLAALAIVPVVEGFHDLDSLHEVKASAIFADRVIETECPAPRAVASLMGLLIAASGCPKTAPFRAMALYHLPFATAEETVTRAAGFWLLNLWAHDALCTSDPFQRLIETWDRLEEVNIQLAKRLNDICRTDAAPNGIAFLDAIAKLGTMGLENRLEGLRAAFFNPGASAT